LNGTPLREVAVICFVTAALSLLGIAEMPYGYYTFLRLVVVAGCVAAAVGWTAVGFRPPLIVAGLTALLFNPVFRVHLERETWAYLNLACAVFMLASGTFFLLRHSRSSQRPRE
jgi:hypothetical protein